MNYPNKKIALFMLPLLTMGCGAEKYFINLARNICQLGFAVDVITMDENFYQKFARALHIFFSLNFFSPIDIKGKETEESVRQNLGLARWRKSSLKNLRQILNSYDIIYAKNEIVDLLILKLIGYKNLPPVIVGVHTPIYYPYARSFPAKLHNFLYLSPFYKWLIKKARLIHLSNGHSYDIIKERFKLRAKLIYYPFSIEEFAQTKQANHLTVNFDKNKINIAFVARLSEQKGLDVLHDLIRRIALDENINTRIILNIFGRGDEKTEQLFREFAGKYDWHRYFGHLENKYIPYVLSQQDLFISPARWETLPYNIIEAQAAGLPVIAFDIPGPNDIVINNETGWLVNNSDEFFARIKNFVSGPRVFERQEIIQHIKNKFSADNRYQELSRLFNEIAEKIFMRKLNFGCGRKIKPGYLNVDIATFPGVDQSFDFNIFPYPLPDNFFDEILADNVLEHLDHIPLVMKELHRLAKPNGEIRIIVPYYHCYGAFNDLTHKHYFSHRSFVPFYEKSSANYFIQEKFALKKLKLVPTRLGKIFLFDFFRRPLSFVFGQLIQTIDIILIVKK